jgi:hypothetical protein
MDAGIFNPGMTDEGRLSLAIPDRLQIPDYLGSVGFEVRIGADQGLGGATVALNKFEILAEYIAMSQVVDTAGVEVAEGREDKIRGNVRRPLGCGRSLDYGQASHKKSECDRLEKSRIC